MLLLGFGGGLLVIRNYHTALIGYFKQLRYIVSVSLLLAR